MIIEKFTRDHPSESDRQDATRPIVVMQMPPLPTLRSFFSELLRSLDCAVIVGSRLSELEHDALRQLKKSKPRLIAIDEIHHLLACTPREQRAALNVLKFLSNELRVSIVALGTGEALHVMRTDPQIASRFESCSLPAWIATEDFRSFIAGFLQQLRVDARDIVNNPIAIDYILELTSGITGRIVELLRLSARLRIATGGNQPHRRAPSKRGQPVRGGSWLRAKCPHLVSFSLHCGSDSLKGTVLTEIRVIHTSGCDGSTRDHCNRCCRHQHCLSPDFSREERANNWCVRNSRIFNKYSFASSYGISDHKLFRPQIFQ
jgi:hypothetical protein